MFAPGLGAPGLSRAALRERETGSDSEDEARGEWSEVREEGVGKANWLRNRLRGKLGKWRSFSKSKLVLSVLESGYRLKWQDAPPPKCRFDNKEGSFGTNENLTSEAVAKLVVQGALQECREDELHCVLALDVHANADDKKRLIVDARPVNKYEVKRSFKCESLGKEGRDVFAGCTHGDSIDISHAYHHVEMYPGDRKYLGIEWKGKFYMCFGWCRLDCRAHRGCFAPWWQSAWQSSGRKASGW